MVESARRVSVQEYLALEADSEIKHEYLSGIVVAMAGASPRHNLVATNVAGLLQRVLSHSPCLVFNSDQRARVEATGSYVYPDISVVCEEARFTDERPRSLENPLLVVEVLSPSTQDHDRGIKLAHYRRLPSLREILLVDTNERRIEHYRRLREDQWIITDITAGAVDLECIDASLAVSDIYAKIDSVPVES